MSHRDFESRPPAVVAFVFAFYAVVTCGFVACTAFLWHFTREGVGFSLSAVVLVLVTAGLGIHVFRMLWLEVSPLLERARARRKLASLTQDCQAPVLRRDLAPDDQIFFDGLAARVCRHHRHGEEAARRKALADLFTFAVASTTHGEALTAGSGRLAP